MATQHKLALTAVLVSVAAAVVLTVAAAVFYAAAVSPLQSRGRAAAERCTQLQSLLRSSRQAMRSQRELRETLSSLTQRARAVRRRVPEHAGEAELLRQLTEIAEGAGVALVDYRRGAIVESADHSQLRLGIKCEGTFEDLCRLLQEVQNLERIVVVERLLLNSSANGDRHPVDMTLLVHFGLGNKVDALG
jgi:Tfp pilus assembly protein PilO